MSTLTVAEATLSINTLQMIVINIYTKNYCVDTKAKKNKQVFLRQLMEIHMRQAGFYFYFFISKKKTDMATFLVFI